MFNLGSIAKQVTGSVSGMRTILSANPKLSAFLLPPQVQMGIKVASTLGLNIPDPDAIVNSVVSDALATARKTLEPSLSSVEALAGSLGSIKVLNNKTADELINSIDWLIG
ncbi:MAG: hypothetical protein KME64_29095 [Scytonematopsis contorta HA4267-MV1]|jgi:hypothetical protein|nr:hypothetical protein [Scytonematopsis contorta HA4267-MV1]